MNFIKKQSAGFYVTSLSGILAIVGLAFYLINCRTDYFMNAGMSPIVVGCAAAAIVAEVLLLAASRVADGNRALDMLVVAPAVLLMVAFVTLVGARVASVATIMTFENNVQTMSDLSSALVAMVCILLGAVVAIVASFCNVAKHNN